MRDWRLNTSSSVANPAPTRGRVMASSCPPTPRCIPVSRPSSCSRNARLSCSPTGLIGALPARSHLHSPRPPCCVRTPFSRTPTPTLPTPAMRMRTPHGSSR
ncbi:hypothetical protein OF83DRAFT_1288922 [Amylostereum chailletii]|nr:hypothetical protein OF83DRAFT_1288922 [Amylostereum chailletii]